MSWKITLKNGDVISNPDFYQLQQYEKYWTIKKLLILRRKVKVGYLWWKRETEETEHKLETVVSIPVDNILKAEKVQCPPQTKSRVRLKYLKRV